MQHESRRDIRLSSSKIIRIGNVQLHLCDRGTGEARSNYPKLKSCENGNETEHQTELSQYAERRPKPITRKTTEELIQQL